MDDSQASLYGSQAGTTRIFAVVPNRNGKLVATKLWDMQTMTPCFLQNNAVTERSFNCWCFLDASTVMLVRVTDLLTWLHLTIRFHHVPVWKWLRLHVIDNDVSMLLIDPSFATGRYDWSRLHSLSDIRWSWWYFMFLDYHPTIKRGPMEYPPCIDYFPVKASMMFSCENFHCRIGYFPLPGSMDGRYKYRFWFSGLPTPHALPIFANQITYQQYAQEVSYLKLYFRKYDLDRNGRTPGIICCLKCGPAV